MLLYSILHLANVKDPRTGGAAVTLDDIKRFRQLDSKCPGHPEYHVTAGVETTTGPLGQGCGMSVGMAIAERWLAKHFNRPGMSVVEYDIYAMCSDGDMMEGISNEAASIAGHLRLGNLCWIYDDNHITIEGRTELAFSDDVETRFRAYGWKVVRVEDANDTDRMAQTLESFEKSHDAPTLIIVRSHIGYGAPNKHDTAAAHGEPLGEDEVRLAKRSYGWPEDVKFLVPDGVHEHFRNGIGRRGGELSAAWRARMEKYRAGQPELAKRFDQIQKRELPDGWDKDLPSFPADTKGVASRSASSKVLNSIAPHYPWLIGGA